MKELKEIRQRLFMLEKVVSEHTAQLNRERGKPPWVMELWAEVFRIKSKIGFLKENKG